MLSSEELKLKPYNVLSYLVGIFYGSSALGPAIGYVLGGTLLNQYVDTPKSPPKYVHN